VVKLSNWDWRYKINGYQVKVSLDGSKSKFLERAFEFGFELYFATLFNTPNSLGVFRQILRTLISGLLKAAKHCHPGIASAAIFL